MRTPLWTGGVDGAMDRVHETGILGSLRWWYEAIVRGLGGSACDPVSDRKCPDGNGWYCDVCAVFGTTGLQRAFRLEGPEWWNRYKDERLKVKISSHRNHRGWFLQRGFMGKEKLKIVPLRWPEVWTEKDLTHSLVSVFTLIAQWSGIGARTQQGYGVVEIGSARLDTRTALESFDKLKRRGKRRVVLIRDLPSIEDFFFARIRFQIFPEQDVVDWFRSQVDKTDPDDELNWYLKGDPNPQKSAVLPTTPIVRYRLRNLVRENMNRTARHRLLGELGRKSLVHVSHSYPAGGNEWEFRIWGWVPDNLLGSVTRSEVLKCLKEWLGVQKSRYWHSAQNGQLWQDLGISAVEVCWFERRENEAPEIYLRSLLEGCTGGANEA